jgi:NAD(P)H-hydrate epimerase
VISVNIILPERVKLPERAGDGHKGIFGKVAVFGGSAGMAGSVCLAATAALRAGAGVAYAVVPEEIYRICQIKLTEVMVKPDNDPKSVYDGADVMVIGPGYLSKNGISHIMEIAKQHTKPVVVDAEGLNYINEFAEYRKNIKNEKCETVITPHPGEFAKMLSITREEVNQNREYLAEKYAYENNLTVLLKGKNTVIASPNGEKAINPTGTDAISTAGSGDVLSGLIGGLMAQGLTAFDAAVTGAYLHGLAGELAEAEMSAYSVMAGDILNFVGKAYACLINN